MGNGTIHCINCGAEVADESGHARCSACGAEFGFARVAAKEGGEVLAYASPGGSGDKAKRRLDRYCLAGLLVSLVSCAFPLIAVAAIVLAIVGLRRVRKTGFRGTDYAVTAIVLSVLGIGVFSVMLPRLQAARAAAINGACQANLRQIGVFILMYEDQHRGMQGYTLDDVVQLAGMAAPSQMRSCPDVQPAVGGKSVSTYVTLSSLQPFSGLRDPASTVIAFELHTHHVPASEGFPEMNHVNALFADGHVEGLPVEKAAGVIERSLLASHRGPATRPER